MTNVITSDMLFYVVAALLGAAGLWLLQWSLFKDRARGRRRCPKCWYDLSGTPGSLVCSECGYAVKRERKLFKTRRRWRWAAVNMLILIAALSSGLTPTVQQHGVQKIVPTTVLIVFSPWLPDPTTASRQIVMLGSTPVVGAAFQSAAPRSIAERLSDELHRRSQQDQLASWQWRLLLRLKGDENNLPWTIDIEPRASWPVDKPVYVNVIVTRQPGRFVWLNSSELRIHLRPANGADDQTRRLAFVTSQRAWIENDFDFDPTICVGRLPVGTSVVTLNSAVERKTRAGDWATVWTGTISTPVCVAKSPRLMHATNDPALDQRLRELMGFAMIDADHIGIRWSRTRIPHEIELPTIAARFELLCDDKVVALARAWWTTESEIHSSMTGPMAVPYSYSIKWEQPVPAEPVSSTHSFSWTLRITGDPSLALRDVRSQSYWSGSISIPLVRHGNEFQRWPWR